MIGKEKKKGRSVDRPNQSSFISARKLTFRWEREGNVFARLPTIAKTCHFCSQHQGGKVLIEFLVGKGRECFTGLSTTAINIWQGSLVEFPVRRKLIARLSRLPALFFFLKIKKGEGWFSLGVRGKSRTEFSRAHTLSYFL